MPLKPRKPRKRLPRVPLRIDRFVRGSLLVLRNAFEERNKIAAEDFKFFSRKFKKATPSERKNLKAELIVLHSHFRNNIALVRGLIPQLLLEKSRLSLKQQRVIDLECKRLNHEMKIALKRLARIQEMLKKT
jgi:hypothetical protein